MSFVIRDLLKTYNDRHVLDIPDLEIRAGELMAVVGPSGAGKSTLLRLLHFLELPNRGLIAYSHNGVERVRSGAAVPIAVRRQIAMVFQRPEMVHGSVRDNVELGLRFRGVDDRERVRQAMEWVDIAHLAEADVSELSGGELQRAALARVLAVRPDVVLFDEPTANLDPANVFLVERMILKMKDAGTTIVLVTHNVFQARRLADRVAFLLEGKLVEVSDAEKFFSEPLDPRSRAFVNGEMVY